MTSFHDPFLAYPARALYSESANIPTHYNYEGYTSGESSSFALKRNHATSSSQASLPSDLPELYYDQNWPSPHSATSPNMICTPPPEWQTPWQLTDSRYISNDPHNQLSPWQGSSLSPRQATRPTVAPIDTNCNWNNHQPKVAENRSMLFTSCDDFDSMQQVVHHPSPFSQASNVRNSGLSPSTLSTKISPSTLSEPSSSYPPTTSQPPLKLHQPRPFRRIPIVSLSKLASACNDFPIPSLTDPRKLPEADPDFGAPSSVYLSRSNKECFYPPVYSSPSTSGNLARVIMCPCGCMESYTFR